jgi:FkbM family methyltransferase
MKKIIKFLDKKFYVSIQNKHEHIQKHWLSGAFYEASRIGMLGYMNTHDKGARKIIDVGASIGNHTLFFAGVLGGEVHSIEPSKKSYDHMVHNVRMNKLDVSCYNIAIGEEKGRCSMEGISTDNIGMTEVREGDDVDIMPIDELDFFEGYDLIKIDVEHYNEEVLRGAKETFTNGTGVIYIEAETEEERDLTDKYMASYGYKRVPNLVLNHTPTYRYVKDR